MYTMPRTVYTVMEALQGRVEMPSRRSFMGREALEDHSQLPKKANKCSWGGCRLFVCMAA